MNSPRQVLFVMSADSSVELQQLIDRFPHEGPEVRRELLERAMDRLRRLTAKILGQSFPALNLVHDVDSVVNETWMRLLPALEKTEPETVQDFFRLAAHKIRHVLLDMVDRGKQFNRERSINADDSADVLDPSQITFDPAQLMMWNEFHQRVETLDEDERKVFEMHYYLEIPKSQIAQVLNISRSRVSQLWIQATDRLITNSSLLDQVQ